jgi:uncharacterized protein YggU (UPF0235/DUF167 family)
MADVVDLEPGADGPRLRLRVKPGGRRDRLVGAYGGALKLEVTAAAERGRANDAVVSLLARTLGVPRAAVSILSGAGSQDKSVRIGNVEPAGVVRCLATLGIPARVVPEGDPGRAC